MTFGVFSYEVYERSWLMQAGDTGDPEAHPDTWIIPRLIQVPPNSLVLVGASRREGAWVLLNIWRSMESLRTLRVPEGL